MSPVKQEASQVSFTNGGGPKGWRCEDTPKGRPQRRNTAMPKARAVRTQRGDHAELSCECEALGVVRQAIAFPLYNFGNELSRAATGCLGLGAFI